MAEALTSLYTDRPEWIRPYLASDALKRLARVDMNCGVNYTSLPLFKNIRPYSRLTHSIDTASLAWHFTRNKAITLACLFHDIATPVFAHTVDFMNGDYEKQESTEENTAFFIESDEVIVSLLKRDHILPEQVTDYHQYPLADNDAPHLSCDRLEYTSGNALNYGFAELSMMQEILNDIVPGKDELIFRHEEQAYAFGLLSLQCGEIYSCDSDRYSMEMLARLLHKAMDKKILQADDLYSDEEAVIQKLLASPMKAEWLKYTSLSEVIRSETKTEDSIMVSAKKRYIDPYVEGKGRLHEINSCFDEKRNAFLKERQDIWLKGVYA